MSDITELTAKVEALTKRVEALERKPKVKNKPTKEEIKEKVRKECYDENAMPKKHSGIQVSRR